MLFSLLGATQADLLPYWWWNNVFITLYGLSADLFAEQYKNDFTAYLK